MNKLKKTVASISTALIMTTMLTPAAMAMSNNSVDIVKSIADDATSVKLGKLTLKEDSDFTNDIQGATSFTYTLPSGIKFASNAVYDMVYYNDPVDGVKPLSNSGSHYGFTVTKSGDYTLTIQTPSGLQDNNIQDMISIQPLIKVDGFDGGDIEATVNPLDSGVTGGKYVIGRVATGQKTAASCIKVQTIGEQDARGGIIRIEENYAGSLEKVTATDTTKDPLFTVKLPNNYKWIDDALDANDTLVNGLAGFSGVTFTTVVDGDRTLKVYGDLSGTGADRGIIEITPGINVGSDAKYGDIVASVEGKTGDVSDADITVATYADYGTAIAAKGELKTALAGQYDNELTKLSIKENIAGSLFKGRKIRVDLPSWVKVTNIKNWDVKTGASDAFVEPTVNGKDSYIEFTYTGNGVGTSKAELEVTLEVSVKGDAQGDIKAVVSGRAGAQGEAILGKAVQAVTATAEARELRVGVKNQALSDIVIAETDKGRIMSDKIDGAYRNIMVELSDGVEWSSTPTVQVVEGNLELDTDNISKDGSFLTIPVKAGSTQASKVKISDIKADLNRTIPEGDVTAKIKGSAVVENDKDAAKYYDNTGAEVSGNAGVIDPGEFDQSTAVQVTVAKVITPAPGEQKRTALFQIGNSKLNIGGVESTMDVAPYIKNDRTYLPVRYVAQAVGVNDSNMMFNSNDQSVVLIKGDRVVKMTIGSNIMTVNGVSIQMDTAPEIVAPGRVMLPVGWVAQALGISAKWDGATQTVTIN
ncbi:copper amine oxidase N-terminal domain-containing protein [Heliobacterium gestii]|uniref:Copper amine oxidase N-terminal domain-containing protein n=1 Tax=Heliomicrobium gestii TaxID=2699 RepID=A0A845LET5_HELGE|nr:stalk domain-containing protein [Heliomicrobium gestii]MBM7866591.1 hypothetical protein [Heliomicrobium gestii]MZP43129.1 copper amine oxidase N-terminal domain-containing protein [Heliomicrobium gestii]